MFSHIPEELKLYSNFINWIEVLEDGCFKPTKKPINPRTGKLASPTDANTWATFEEAVIAAPYCSGIGFVLSQNVPFSVIDLDDPYEKTQDGSNKYSNPEEISKRQQLIASVFDSYQEISPSGRGLHVWIKGKVPSGRRRECVEVYSDGRYMTVTGNVFNNKPINNHEEKLKQLWEEMEAKNVSKSDIDKPQIHDDNTILTFASQAANGQKFIDLYEGRFKDYYPSQSEADFAFVDIVAFYTQNREQIVRIFKASQLGKRKKAERKQYVEYMLDRAFDNQLPEIDLDALKNNLEKQLNCASNSIEMLKLEFSNENSASKFSLGEDFSGQPLPYYSPETPDSLAEVLKTAGKGFHFSPPPGLVGEIANFIYSAAPRPVPEIAIAGALALIAGICGRSYNISGTGLNQYLLLLAVTGTGKESCSNGIDKLLSEVQRTVPAVNEFVGPGEIASPQALLKYMNKTSKCFLSIVGEFGLRFKQMADNRASNNEIGLKRMFLDLYNKSGKSSVLKPLIYSDKDKNTEPIQAPAFSMLGETTPETFYENLNSALISDGLLPRFTIIEYKGKRPELNEQHLTVKPSQFLVDQFSALCAYSLQLNNGNNVIEVKINENALQLYKDFDKYCDSKINDASNDVTRQLWNRAHIKALKLGALLSVGCNYINPVINHECCLWALRLIIHDVNNLLTRFESGEIGASNVQNEQTVEIQKAFKKYVSSDWKTIEKLTGATLLTYSMKVIPHSFITAICRQKACFKSDKLGPVNAIKVALQSLVDCGEIVELSIADKRKASLSLTAKLYMVAGMKV